MAKVFLADDSEILRNRLKTALEEITNIEILGESGIGIEALNQILKLHPDIAIIDIRMPTKSGIEILKEIKDKQSDIKVIVFTNYPFPQYRERCMSLGADHFFEKSTEFDKLLSTIEFLAA